VQNLQRKASVINMTDATKPRPDSPCLPRPTEPKIEDRRLVIQSLGRDRIQSWLLPIIDATDYSPALCDEIRRCEIDDAGRVVRVLEK
jgi:hypothetical protein